MRSLWSTCNIRGVRTSKPLEQDFEVRTWVFCSEYIRAEEV